MFVCSGQVKWVEFTCKLCSYGILIEALACIINYIDGGGGHVQSSVSGNLMCC